MAMLCIYWLGCVFAYLSPRMGRLSLRVTASRGLLLRTTQAMRTNFISRRSRVTPRMKHSIIFAPLFFGSEDEKYTGTLQKLTITTARSKRF